MLNTNEQGNLMVEIDGNISLYPWEQTDELNSNIGDAKRDSAGILIATSLDDWNDAEGNVYDSNKDYEAAANIKVIEQALNLALDRLGGLESDSQLLSKLELAFDNSFNRTVANSLISDFAQDNFDSIPAIKLVSGDTLNSANGSYDSLSGFIYLSREFVASNQDNFKLITDVILEEIGHHLDRQINQSDAPGDEGELFSNLVSNSLLSIADINRLKAEDDTALIIIDGQEVTVENSLPTAAEVDLGTLQEILPDSLGNIISQDLISEGENGATVLTWSNAFEISSLVSGGEYLPELALSNLTLTVPATENSHYELAAEATIAGEVYLVLGSLKKAEEIGSNKLVWDSLAIADLDAQILESLLSAQFTDLSELIPDNIERLTLAVGENSLQVTYDGAADLVSWIPNTAILAGIDSYLPDLTLDNPSIKITNNSNTVQYSLLGDITIGDDTVSLTGDFDGTTLNLLTLESFDTNLAVDDWFDSIPLINDKFPTLNINRPRLTIDGESKFTFDWHNAYKIDKLFGDTITSFNLPSGFTDNFLGTAEFSDHSLSILEDGAGVQYSGQYNDDKLEVIYLDDEFTFNYEPNNELALGDWFQDIPLIEDITIADPKIFLGNAAFTDPETGLDLGEGFNIAGALDLSNSENQYLRWTSEILGIDTLDIAVGYSSLGAINLSAQLDLDIPLISGSDFSAILRDAQIDFNYDGSEPTFTIDGEVDLAIDGENLGFSGGFILEPESVTGFFALKADSDGWDTPFGVPDSEIRNLGFQIGGTYQLPSIDNIGFIGDLQFGNFDIETAVLGDINDPDNLALVATPNESLPLTDILLGPVASYVFSQAADNLDFVRDFRNLLDRVLDVQLKPYDSDGDGEIDPLIQIVPVAGVEIANVPLEEGISLNAAIDAWGQSGRINLAGDRHNKLLAGSLSLDRIDLGNGVLVIEGFNDSQVNLDLLLSDTEQYLKGDASINFLGQQLAGINLAASQNGLEFEFSQNLENFKTNLQVTVDDSGFSARGGLNTTLNLDITTALGTINLVDLGFNAQASLALDENSFTGSINGSFDFYGNTFDLSLSVDAGDLDSLEGLIFDAVRAQIQSSIGDIFSTVEDWASGIENGIVDFAGDAADFVTIATDKLDADLDRITDTLWNTSLVSDARQLADVLSDNTDATAKDLARTLKSQLGLNTDTIADALSYGAGLPISSIADALSSSTFVANPDELSGILQRSTKATTSQISDALSSVEAGVSNTANDVSNTVSNTAKNVGNTVSNTAKNVGKSIGNVVGGIFG